MFTRESWLIGDKLDLIKSKTVLVIGLGGVGGYTVETLVRAGIESIIIVDNDVVDITNLNRQIVSLHSNIGNKKVDEWEKRIKDINPNVKVTKYDMFVTKDNINTIFENKIDPSRLSIKDIRKTSYDPIAKKLRKMIKDERIKDKIMVISSEEEPLIKGKVGSISYVPSVAGIYATSYIINDILRS